MAYNFQIYPQTLIKHSYIIIMLLYISLVLVVLAIFISYRYYFKPRAEIKRYIKILKSLGYTVHEQTFQFFGISPATLCEKGLALHKDAMYYERTIFAQVDISIGNLLNQVVIILVNPELIKDFLSGNMPYKYPKLSALVEGTKAALGQGLVFSEGEIWKKKRKLLSKVFNFDLIKENIPKISEICDRCFNDYDEINKTANNKVKYDILGLSARIFNGVIMKCFFGTDEVKQNIGGQKFEQFVVDIISEVGQLTQTPLLVFFGKFAWGAGLTARIRNAKEKVRLLTQKSKQILKQRTQEISKFPKKQKSSDIISALIYEKLENNEEFSYSDQDLIDEFQTFLVAGTDTTTRFFTMIVYYIGKYPQVQKKLRQQVKNVIKTDADITYQNLKKLTYVDWIQLETTRHYGPANGLFYRVASEDNYIKNIPICKGTVVSTQPRGNHYNQKYFKNPNEFRPERWQKECDGIHPYALLGFSSGIRNCIGKQLAHLQSKIALVKLIRRYEEIEVPDEIAFKMTFLYEAQHFETTFTKKTKEH